MIQVTIGKRKYLHPSKADEVTLAQAISLLGHDNDIDAFSAFSGIPVKELKSVPTIELYSHMEAVSSIIHELNNTDTRPYPESFKIGRTTYYPSQDLDNEPAEKYIDCTHYMRMFKGNEMAFYPYMMAIYCTKKNEKYEDINLEDRAEVMRKALAVDAVSIASFFLFTSKVFPKDYLAYFQENPAQTK